VTDYPNREHQVADEAARRRALAALDHITDEAEGRRQRILAGRPTDGDDTQTLTSLVRDLTVHLTVLGTLRDAREWHAADQAEAVTEARP
jgi:hypothetical protein